MKRCSMTTLAIVLLMLCLSQITYSAKATLVGYPSEETQTLMSSLFPLNATVGDNITWLVWTDPNCSGQEVTLTIWDETNDTMISEGTGTLGTTHECGSLKLPVSTVGFLEHEYKFIVRMEIGNMEIESYRYLDLTVAPPPTFGIIAYATPYELLPGETTDLRITETLYPYVAATADIRVYNLTQPNLWTTTGVAIPATNGSCTIKVPTTGLVAGSYSINVTATSAIGVDSSMTSFWLTELFFSVERYSYYLGELVNVSIRTYPTVSEAGLKIFMVDYTTWPFTYQVVVDEAVPLTLGEAHKSYDSSGWTPSDSYQALCNVTIDTRLVTDTGYFSLRPFDVDVNLDKYQYIVGSPVNISISTTLPKPGATFNITVSKDMVEVWTYGPSTLDSHGKASVIMDTAGFEVGYYDVEVTVFDGTYEEEGSEGFSLFVETFAIFADVNPYMNQGYAMPNLTITTVPGQTNANLTIMVGAGWAFETYQFNKTNFDVSYYVYFLPLPGMPSGTYVTVEVNSGAGTNETTVWLQYISLMDTDGDGLSDIQEATLLTDPNNPDTDGDGFFDGIEVFHGSDPLNPASVIPEFGVPQLLVVLCMTATFYVAIRKKIIRRNQKPS